MTTRPSAPVDRGAQIIGDVIGNILLDRDAGGDACTLAHGLLGPVGIAPAQFREPPDEGDGIVDDLACHRVFGGVLVFTATTQAATAHLDGCRRSEIGRGRHHRHMARIENVGARTRGPRAAGRDVSHHGHVAGEDQADDVAGGGIEPARRVHADDEHGIAKIARLFQPLLDQHGDGGADPAFEIGDDGAADVERGGVLDRRFLRPLGLALDIAQQFVGNRDAQPDQQADHRKDDTRRPAQPG